MTEHRENESIIDLEEALVVTAGDREMLVSLGEMFMDEGPKQLMAIHEQIEAGNAPGIRDTAHTLKGSVAIFGARNAAAAAVAVEHAANDGDLSGVPAAWDALQLQINLLMPEIEKLCRD